MTVPFSTNHTFNRGAIGDYVDGTWVETTPAAPVVIKCCIQPYKSGQDSIIPRVGGRWSDGMISIDSESNLLTDKDGDQGDRITYNGDTYEVISREAYIYGRQTDHYECYGQKIDDNTN